MFANGIGPCELVEGPGDLDRESAEELYIFAKEYVSHYESDVGSIADKVQAEFPTFEKMIDDLCR